MVPRRRRAETLLELHRRTDSSLLRRERSGSAADGSNGDRFTRALQWPSGCIDTLAILLRCRVEARRNRRRLLIYYGAYWGVRPERRRRGARRL